MSSFCRTVTSHIITESNRIFFFLNWINWRENSSFRTTIAMAVGQNNRQPVRLLSSLSFGQVWSESPQMPGTIPGVTGKWDPNPSCPRICHCCSSCSGTQHLFFGTTQLPDRFYSCFMAPAFGFFCHLCVTGGRSACDTGQGNLIYVRCIRWEVRTRSLEMTNIASDRVPTSLNCLPFSSTFMRERRKTEHGTLHAVSHFLIIHHRLLVLQKASAEFPYKKLIRKIRCNETR